MALASRLLRRNLLHSHSRRRPPTVTLPQVAINCTARCSMSQSTASTANGNGAHANPTFTSKFISPTFRLPYPQQQSSTIPSFNDINNWPTDPMQVFCQWYQDAESDYLQRTNNMKEPHIEISLPNQIQIATIDKQRMIPQLRTVLLKGIDSRGLIFFTNYNGNKGKQLQQQPYAAVNLYIKSLERQIRVEGTIEYLTGVESDLYFHQRPIPSQVGAAVSKQSSVIPNRDDLEERYLQTVHRIADQIKQHTSQHQQKGSASLAQSQQQNATLDQQQQKQTDSNTPTASELTGPRYQQALDTLKQYESSDLKDELCGLVQRPTNWGGFLLRPTRFEYWCDGKYRLHSRIQYTSSEYDSVAKSVKPLQQPTAEDSIAHQRSVNSEEVQQELQKAVSRGPLTSDQQWERVFLSP